MTKKETNIEIELKPIKIKEAVVTIKGKTPLIVNNFSEKSKQQIVDAQMKKPKVKTEKDFLSYKDKYDKIIKLKDLKEIILENL